MRIHIIPNILNDEDIDVVLDEIVNKKDFEKSFTEIETFDIIEELKYPQEYDDGGIIILDDLNEKEMKDPRVQALFKRSNTITYPSSYSVKIITNYQRERSELRVISTTSLNQTISEMY